MHPTVSVLFAEDQAEGRWVLGWLTVHSPNAYMRMAQLGASPAYIRRMITHGLCLKSLLLTSSANLRIKGV